MPRKPIKAFLPVSLNLDRRKHYLSSLIALILVNLSYSKQEQ
ncbi:hypothetical protein NEOC65_000772 [Neochlamydia sp. AcF65]|nr:hypothetical protein [Neochlamydia sp. AcF65]MBS4170075.1 hypothetical protein [Neochlamydia sp. AcF95]